MIYDGAWIVYYLCLLGGYCCWLNSLGSKLNILGFIFKTMF